MSLYYHEPFFSLNDFGHFFDDFFPERTSTGRHRHQRIEGGDTQQEQGENQVARAFQPRLDIYESPETNQVIATFELPGLKKEDITIDVRNGRLLVAGEVNTAREYTTEAGYVHRERRSGKFSRTVPLPAGTQPQDIKASLEDGVLTVTFPKTSAEQEPKKITIQ